MVKINSEMQMKENKKMPIPKKGFSPIIIKSLSKRKY